MNTFFWRNNRTLTKLPSRPLAIGQDVDQNGRTTMLGTRNPEAEILHHIFQLTMMNGRTSGTPVIIRLAKRTHNRKTPKHRSIRSRLSWKSDIPGGHWYFGNNYTAQNIIQGLLQYDSVSIELVTLSSQLHASLNHARVLLLQQDWYKHDELHKKIAICEFEQGFAVSPHSIHCAHLLPAKNAEENN